MAKKSAKPQHVEPEDISQDMPEEEPVFTETPSASPKRRGPGRKAKSEAISKSEAVRRALAAGMEGGQEGSAYILKEFGLEVAPGHFSAVKATEKKKAGATKGKPGRKPRAAAQVAEVSQVAAPARPKASNGEADVIDALEALKPLIASHGADRVKRLVDLLG